MKKLLVLKVLALVLFFTLGAYCFVYFDWYVYFTDNDKSINLIESFHPFDKLVFIVIQIIQVVFAPIPGELTGLIGGYLYGIIPGTIYSTIGLTLGSWLAFMLARRFGLPLVKRTVSPEILRKYDYLMAHQGVLVSFVLFLIPGFPKDFLCYIMGLSHMRTMAFLAVSTIGRLLGTVMLSIFGFYARENQYWGLAISIGLSGLALLLAYVYREKWIHALRKKENA